MRVPSLKTSESTSAGSGPLKQGPLLLFNSEVCEYVRCCVVLTDGGLSFRIHGGLRARQLRPRLAFSGVRNVFGHTADVDADAETDESPSRRSVPELHYLVCVIETVTEAIVLRSADRDTIRSWIAAIADAVPERPLRPIADMDTALRAHFPPQLDSLLFPKTFVASLAKQGSPSRVPTVPSRRVAPRARMVSQSAAAPQRNAVTKGAHTARSGIGLSVSHLPADTLRRAHFADPTADQDAAERRRRSVQVHVVTPDRAPSSAESSPMAASAGSKSPASPAKVPTAADVEIAALRKELEAEKEAARQMRRERDDASARCLEYEIDSSNAAVRVLDLESEVRTLKSGIAEWRRRYTSLEEQLKLQEDGMAARVQREKDEQLEVLEEQVKGHWERMSAEWREREAALVAEVAALKSERELETK
jgi:hypothetical protein